MNRAPSPHVGFVLIGLEFLFEATLPGKFQTPSFRRLAGESQVGSQISPGRGFIEQVEDFLFGSARARNVKDVVISEFYYLGDALSGFCRRLGFPLAQPSIEFLRQCVHGLSWLLV